MDLETRLDRQRSALLRSIAEAARKGDARAVLEKNRRLQNVERLAGQLLEVQREVEALDTGGFGQERQAKEAIEKHNEVREGSPWRSTGKDRGTHRRLEFIKGLPPTSRPEGPVAGAVFTAPKVGRVGVAYAHEGTRVNRWFLGLRERKFDHAVLLCEANSGRVTHFSLPKEFIDRYGTSLSRKNGQLKFNVMKQGGEFHLLVRPGRHVNLEQFRDNHYGLR